MLRRRTGVCSATRTRRLRHVTSQQIRTPPRRTERSRNELPVAGDYWVAALVVTLALAVRSGEAYSPQDAEELAATGPRISLGHQRREGELRGSVRARRWASGRAPFASRWRRIARAYA